MARFHFALAATAFLAACGNGNGTNPITGGPGGGGGDDLVVNPIAEELAGNLSRIAYNPAAGTLTVEMSSLDAGDYTASYTRTPALDVPGYTAFSFQDDPLDRMFVALVAASIDGAVQAGVVADGGQFNRYFRGGYYERTGSYTQPTSGQVSYAGLYAGITNEAGAGTNLLPVPPGTDPALIPSEPRVTVGTAFLNVSFGDNTVNGAIYNREFADNAETLPGIALTSTDLDGNGEFLGTTEFLGLPDEGSNGNYGGILGGVGATSVAGVIYLDNIYLSTDPRDTNFDSEVGVFVLPRCGTVGAPPICGIVN